MLKHTGTQRIETEHLILRRFTMEDAGPMYENWASDPEVTKYLTWPPHSSLGVTEGIIRSWIEGYAKEDCYQWAIVLKENGDEPIGSICAMSHNARVEKTEVGYCIGRKWWHRGIMSEALQAVMDFLFDQVGMNRVEARHDPRNPHSGAVMGKCGMRFEGTLRQADWNNQGVCDICQYAMVADDRKEREGSKCC